MAKLIGPADIERTGDPTPVRSLSKFVWRMSARHQAFVSILALIVAALSMAPLGTAATLDQRCDRRS